MKRFLVVMLMLMSAACGRDFSRGPTSATAHAPASSATGNASITWDQAIASRASIAVTDHHLPGPSAFQFIVNGSTVLLGWTAASGPVTQYVIEAGSASGLSNIAVFPTGSAATGIAVTNVPNGVYFARLRAIVNGELTAVSNEIVVTVGGVCAGEVSPLSTSVPRTASIVSINVSSTCPWTAASNAPFLAITSGNAGVGAGVVSVLVTGNSGATRTGSLTVAGQTVLITQAAGSLHVGFDFYDPSTQSAVTTECRINANPSTCVLRSTSFPFGTQAIVNYDWTVQYTYAGEIKTLTQSGSNPEFQFSEVCGLTGSDATGAPQPLSATLVVTDSAGDTGRAVSGSHGQPALQLRLFTCS